MANPTGTDRIDDVTPGDIITIGVPDDLSSADPQEYKVVHIDQRETSTGSGYLVTVEKDDGETFDVDVPAGTMVTRSLESKWESPQSPTMHRDPLS